MNRVLLLTDGLANAGITDPDLLVGLCRSAMAQGITTSTIGFGKGFDEELLGRMAETGGGGTYYIEHADQAPTKLGELYAREPRLLLAEFIVLPDGKDDEMAVAEVVVSAQVLTAGGGVESRRVRLPIRMSPRPGPSVHPEVRKELILQQAARARDEARETQSRGAYDGASSTLRQAYAAVVRISQSRGSDHPSSTGKRIGVMKSLEPMLATHPDRAWGDRAALVECLRACHDCVATCTICADACLAEEKVQMLRRCIRLNLDCADICEATAAVLSRQTESDAALLRLQLQACVKACELCGEECGSHAEHHEHCRICSEACRRCAEACTRLLSTLGA